MELQMVGAENVCILFNGMSKKGGNHARKVCFNNR